MKEDLAGLIILAYLFISSYISRLTGIGFIGAILLVVIAITTIVIYFKYRERQRYLQSGISEIDKMSGIEFEKCLMHHFNKLGYIAETTAKSHDYGADLIMKSGKEKIIVQAKRYNSKVGIKAVQEAIGAMAYYKADRCFVITNNYYTPSAKNLAINSNVELWDRDTIIRSFNINDTIIENNDQSASDHEHISEEICPQCGKKLVLRNGSRGKFYGCSGFPACRFTKGLQ
jgi:restriction system protein